MSMVRSCHHYYMGNVCRICGFDKTPGTLRGLDDVIHRAAWKGGVITVCEKKLNNPVLCSNTRKKVVTCLYCVGAS